MKQSPEHIGLYNLRTDTTKDNLSDQKTLGDCGYKSGNSKAQDPAPMGMVFLAGEEGGEVTLECFVYCGVYMHYAVWSVRSFQSLLSPFLPGDKFEDPIVTPYSSPPELPDVMKPQDAPAPLQE